MALRILIVILSTCCVFTVGCPAGDSGSKGQTAETVTPPPAPAEAPAAPEEVAAASSDWKERLDKSLAAIEASEDPWAATCEQLDALQKAWADGDPEVKRVLNFEEEWARLGAKLGRSKAFCDRNEKPVLPAGNDFVKDLKTPWEAVKAKLP